MRKIKIDASRKYTCWLVLTFDIFCRIFNIPNINTRLKRKIWTRPYI